MAAGATRNAEAILAASRPSTVWSISGVRAPASIAGCAQTNISFSRSSGKPPASSPSPNPDSACRRRAARRPVERRGQVGHVEDDETAELLLGVGVRPVLDGPLAVAEAQRRAGRRRLQSAAAGVMAGILQGVGVRLPGTPVGAL